MYLKKTSNIQAQDRFSKNITPHLSLLCALLFTLLILPSTSFAETAYVKSNKAVLLEKPVFGSPAVVTLFKGAKLTVIKRDGRWVQVTNQKVTGWLSTLLIGASPPLKKISVFSDTKEDLNSSARRRASAFTSAAAARGLTDRKRASSGYLMDHAGVSYMKSHKVNPDELEAFIKQGATQ